MEGASFICSLPPNSPKEMGSSPWMGQQMKSFSATQLSLLSVSERLWQGRRWRDVFFPIFFLSSICFQNVCNECISVVRMFVQCKQWTHLKEIRLEIQENVFLYQGHSQFANISWLFPGPVVMKRFHALHMYLSKYLITTCILIPTCHSIIHKNQLNCPFLTTMTQTLPSKRGRI